MRPSLALTETGSGASTVKRRIETILQPQCNLLSEKGEIQTDIYSIVPKAENFLNIII
jgi:hypothetical protein